jgi:glycosyltransferase involved in cell wall biosynthesis
MPKKNPELLVRMMEWLPDQKLVIAGSLKGDYARNLKTLAEQLPARNVEFVGEVDDAQKAKLYAGCKMFLFPSLCEGFGLPPIEAMKFGKPVALSNLTSLPEIGGPNGCYWDELEPRKMAEQLTLFMNDHCSEESSAEIKNWAAQLTWEECARRYAELYIRMVNG